MKYGIDDLLSLADRLYGHEHTRKPPIYLNEYHRLFCEMQDKPIRLLELGVQRGISMQIWREYFPRGTIVGLDSSVKPERFPTESRFHFIHGEQGDPALLDRAVTVAGGPFDIIIDDASHLGCHTGRSFAHLFPKALKPGGIYVIEDTCTAYEGETGYDGAAFEPAEIGVPGMPKVFPSHQHGMIGLLKQLVDHTMAPTATGGYTEYAIERMTFQTNFAVLHKAANPGQPIKVKHAPPLHPKGTEEPNAKILRLEAERAALIAELDSVHQSNSWRITGPLRWARRMIGGSRS
jgi:hypothetical protein